jgi:acetylornithine deacetylase
VGVRAGVPQDQHLDPIDLTCALIRVDSVNPGLVPGGAGESAAADLVGGWLAGHGFEVRRLEGRPGRPSVVGIARGRGGGRALMLNGHLDTVTLAGYDGDPLQPVLRDGAVHGRGAFDMKSGIAAMLVAAARATRPGLRGDVLVACVADEEFASAGTEEVLEHFTADGAVVVEPSHLEVTTAHKGFVWLEVQVHGVAAHGSRPELGVDAIAKAGHVLVAIEDWGRRLAAGPAHPQLGAGSVHASLVSGGEEASSYPALCTITIERRTVPGETAVVVESELAGLLDRLTEQVPDFRASWRRTLAREPFQADPGSALVTALVAHAERALGRQPGIRAEPFWTDCALLAEAGVPAVLFGVDGGGAHAATEWADIASVHTVIDVLEAAIRQFCA